MLFVVFTVVALACDSRSTSPTPAPAGSAAAVERRPFVLFLHGLGGNGTGFRGGLGVAELAEKYRFSYASPDGDFDSKGRRFWNAWNACCDFDGKNPDHVAGLGKILDDARSDPKVDPARVWVLGYSNGGFMAHRLACERPGIAAIVSIAGMGPNESEPCKPAAPVRVIQIHGDADTIVSYAGGRTLGAHDGPSHVSARQTVLDWAKRRTCDKSFARVDARDLVRELPGDETTRETISGCGPLLELWTVAGGDHGAPITKAMMSAVFDALSENR